MLMKNTRKFTVKKTKISLRNILIIILFGFTLLTLSNCKKLELLSGSQSAMEQFFASNILDKNFIISFASDSTANITNTFSGYAFKFSKTTSFYEGTITAAKTGTNFTGTWSTNSDFSKLIINLTTPTIPTELVFLNRAWKFTKKDLELMILAPWYNDGPKVLNIKKQ